MKKIFDDGTYETWEKRESWFEVLIWVLTFIIIAAVLVVLLGGFQ